MIIFLAPLYLELTYRKGLGGLAPNLEKAYNCLLHLKEQNLPNYAEKVHSELKKYKKGLFGGYTYTN